MARRRGDGTAGQVLPDSLSDDEITERYLARRARAAARRHQHAADGLPDRDTRRARRAAAGVPPPMTGWRTGNGGSAFADHPTQLVLPGGAVAVQAPTSAGAIVPQLLCGPGQSVTVGADITGPRGFIGLQWVGADGTGGDILWAGGRGRVTVTGTAPAGTAGARMLLVSYSRRPVDLNGRDAVTVAIQQNLRAWLHGRGDDGF